jgi:hypothetical protein
MKTLIFNTRVKDKDTGKTYEPGAKTNFDDERADAILATGYANVVKEKPQKDADGEKTDVADAEVKNDDTAVDPANPPEDDKKDADGEKTAATFKGKKSK